MNQQTLTSSIKKRANLSSHAIEKGVSALKEIIIRTLSEGRTVSIPNFGSFAATRYPEETETNPQNPGELITLPPIAIPKFRASDNLRLKIRTVIPHSDTKDDSPYSRPVPISYLDLSKKVVPKDILSTIPEHIARRYQTVPVEIRDGTLVVSMIDPEDQEAIEFIKKRTGMPVEATICTQDDINHILDQYSGLQAEVSEIVESSDISPLEAIKEEEENEESNSEDSSEHAPAAKIVASLLKRAVHDKASDIHIEPMEDELTIRFRIDGVLRKIVSLPKTLHPAIVSRIKILSSLKIDEQRLPQDGRFQIRLNQGRIDFRISTLPTVNGEKVVARILDKSAGILSLEDLGMRGSPFEVLKENITKSHGMILVTGPTGSGKTTTLYAVLDRLRNVSVNIITLEDPVEYRMAGLNQCQINTEIGYTFASGLRSILRQDPNIVMVGEIRDFDTANISIHAALTGHIVLSTLHTNDAAGAIPRLMDMGIEPFLITSSINAVVAQRLCRKICPDCKEEVKFPPDEIAPVVEELKLIPPSSSPPIDLNKLTLFHGKGCASCGNSGYHGRIGIFEVLPVNENLKNLVTQKVNGTELQKAAIKEGMITLKQDGILKALEGLTTIEEIWRVTKD